MTGREAFGVFLRCVGLLLSFLAVLYGLGALFAALGLYRSDSTVAQYAAAFVVMLTFGLYFLRGAPALVRFSYPDASRDRDPHAPPAV